MSLTEALAEGAITDCGLDGVMECRESCSTSAESVEISIDKAKQFMKDYRKPQ